MGQGFRFLAKRECPALEGFRCSAKWEKLRLAKLGARGFGGDFAVKWERMELD